MMVTHASFSGLVLGAFPDVSVNLIAAAIGGAAVWLATRTGRRVRLLRARRFWKSMGSRGPFIVLGAPDWEPLGTWEKSGMVGKGEILALVEIETQLRELGFEGKIVESKELNSRDLRSDLVLIGGPDGNSVTATMLGRLDQVVSYEFTRDTGGGNAVIDRRTDSASAPQYDQSGDPISDYGLIIRAANPLAPETAEIVILAGCWGYGTTAAAEKLSDRRFLRKQRKSKHFEALVETTVVRGAHYNTRVRDTREITPATDD
ncbi:hypothetical protein [Amycolatopsis kentuckyensis]|uniref:hypothetical protein n=1 Tax=Amycolatopsis kentuckyensis TaxID=218823 RepID=UPI000A3A5F28|nr:hypothetical protein [Amycolatopsis kentuckyensis]